LITKLSNWAENIAERLPAVLRYERKTVGFGFPSVRAGKVRALIAQIGWYQVFLWLNRTPVEEEIKVVLPSTAYLIICYFSRFFIVCRDNK
jgi:hypothetical protein